MANKTIADLAHSSGAIGNTDKFEIDNGSSEYRTFAEIIAALPGTVAGSDTQFQYNSSGSLAGAASLLKTTTGIKVFPTTTTGSGTSGGFVVDAESLTQGDAAAILSGTVTTGKLLKINTVGNTWTGNSTSTGLVDITCSSTGGAVSDISMLLNLARSGTNAHATHQAYGLNVSVTNTGTTSTNVAANLTASGATTNIAITATGLIQAYGAISATANYGKLSIGSGAAAFDGSTSGFFAGSSAGTHLAVNAASGFTGSLIDLQTAGVTQLSLSGAGVMVLTSKFTLKSAPTFATGELLIQNNVTGLNVVTLQNIGSNSYSALTFRDGVTPFHEMGAIGFGNHNSSDPFQGCIFIGTSNFDGATSPGNPPDFIVVQSGTVGGQSADNYTRFRCEGSTGNINFYDKDGSTVRCQLGPTGGATVTTTQGANTSADGLVLVNSGTATSGNQMYSSRLRLTGAGFKSNSVAASQVWDWIIENQPVQGTTVSTSNLVFSSQISAGGYAAKLTLDSAGTIFTANGVSIDANGNIAGIAANSGINISVNGGSVPCRWNFDVAMYSFGLLQKQSNMLAWTNGSSFTNSADTGIGRQAAGQIKIAGVSGSTLTPTFLVLGLDSGANGLVKCPNAASGAGNHLYMRGSNAGSGDTDGGSLYLVPGILSGAGNQGEVEVKSTEGYGSNPYITLRVSATTSTASQRIVLRNDAGTDRGLVNVGSGAALWAGANTLNMVSPDGNLGFFAGNAQVASMSSTELIMANAINIQTGTATGTIIASGATQKLGFWGATPVTQWNTSNTVGGFNANTTANVVCLESNFSGTIGSTLYTISDLVNCLKNAGFLAA